MIDPESFAGGLLERTSDLPDADSTFFLAAGGLRRLRGCGEELAGYTAGEMFWRDVLELLHEEDRAHARELLSEAAANPGAVLRAGLRMRDVNGDWRFIEAAVQNVVDVAGDEGLVLADLREIPSADGSADGHGGPQTPLP